MNPSESGAALARVGSAMQGAGVDLAHEQQENEIRTVQVQAAQMKLQAHQQIDEAINTPSPDWGAIQDQIANEYSKLGDNLQTQGGYDAAQVFAANDRAELGDRIRSASAMQYGNQIKAQGGQLLQTLGSLVTRSPTSLEDALKQVDIYTSTFKGKLQPAQLTAVGTDLKQQISVAAGEELIRRNPAAAQSIVQSLNISPQQRESLIQYGTEQQRAAVVQQEYGRAAFLFRQKQQSDASQDKWLQEMTNTPQGVNAQAIMADKTLLPSAKENLVLWMHRKAEAGWMNPTSDPASYTGIMTRLSLPATDPNGLNAQSLSTAMEPLLKSGALTLPDSLQLQEYADKRETSDPNVRQVGVMTRMLQRDITNIYTPQQIYSFTTNALKAVQTAEGKGQRPQDTLFNPKSPEYILSPLNLHAIMGEKTAAKTTPKIPQAAVSYLEAHPDTAALFDQRFGAGSAARIISAAKSEKGLPW